MTAPPMLNPGFERPIRSLSTTRQGGLSGPPFDAFNLGLNSGDDAVIVRQNRARLSTFVPSEPCWLQQVHSTDLIHLDDWAPNVSADAAWTDRPGQVAVVLTADCLPILVADGSGAWVAAIHAGWRGLAAGIVFQVLEQLPSAIVGMRAWLGPSIRQPAYEVGAEVIAAFAHYPNAIEANQHGRWQLSLQRIAHAQLIEAGVQTVVDSERCTLQDSSTFFSHRRSAPCGRQASLIWME
ncbi:MAG: peptidoglycan editing factor PgeF [Pseudomonadota bacterium]